ncbi:MAG: D-alanyl-D-alanine carboxypeptidase [Candidatus Collierbacteria bacterium GW2011_GWB2_45_17]|uniref:D-alanyl-D-alanine carboxypeptidase n=1 Tax=Candidatus Collierbacteria bacterium GW2011_GWB2_45_17 TaxID=1618388 RepID=A0A837IG41_9BACT|nr:MAG: D-alanyl-D-alanine carboxypeptidase [Candidatus Collierbacteria bacterium GW2011_GWB2_45_17]
MKKSKPHHRHCEERSDVAISLHPSLRFFFNISALFSICLFFIFSPVMGRLPGPVKPSVKAAYTSEPKSPVSQKLSPPSFTTTGIFVMDLDTGIVLLDKNPPLRLKPASLTKIMTSLVALDYYSEGSVLKVINGQKSLGNTVKLVKGDELTASEVIYALLVPSGNDAAVTLAENYPGGYQQFVKKMNQKITELGLSNTNFTNVSGVESPNHYTSAYDIAMIARTALRRPAFSTIVSTKNITITSLKGHTYPLESTNILLGKPGIVGVKTGWTPEAGECLVILVTKDNHPVLISLLNSNDRFGEAQKIINWVYSNYLWQ